MPSTYTSFLAQPIYQNSPPSSLTTTSLSPPPSTVTVTPEPRHTLRHHHSHHQLFEDNFYSMASVNHPMSSHTAPSSPVMMPMINDESDLDDLGRHGIHQDDDGPHICQWGDCRLEFQLLDHLIDHTKSLHIGSGKPLYYCRWKDCARGDKPFTKRHKMHNHLRTHTGERPFICMEDGCGKRFSRPDSLTTHSKIHTNIRPHVCQHENCDKAYYHLRSLRKHEKSHEIPPPLPTPTILDQHLTLSD
ncbi:hypothetical protein BC941DRAFT_407815 [Chlamydoabsidia padenii]|nr:hypothetical protein BC941DRAFT_407815 [Chlamydoabsidia padenii]